MNIVKNNVASIANNDPEGERVELSVAYEVVDGIRSYFIVSDSGEDCGPHFNCAKKAEDAIFDMWGKSAEWDLQYN